MIVLYAYGALCLFCAVVFVASRLAGVKWTFTVGTQRVEDPILAALCATFVMPYALLLCAASIPLHVLLKLFGRRGFWLPGPRPSYVPSFDGFKRA